MVLRQISVALYVLHKRKNVGNLDIEGKLKKENDFYKFL